MTKTKTMFTDPTKAENTTLAQLAVSHPAASRIFQRLGLDYCCGGQRSLAEACSDQGLEASEVLSQIASARQPEQTDRSSWAERPLEQLVHFIVDRYHASLRRELPELVALADKVERRHAEKESCPRGLGEHLRNVHGAVLDHLAKEEQVLFPMILAGQGNRAGGPVQVMEHEHHEHAANLQRIREMTRDLKAPPEACTSWQALYLRLGELEAELMEHIHLENNVLFPRALCE